MEVPHEIVTICDPATGAIARLLPTLGYNCFQFQVPTRSGLHDVLWSEPGFELGDRRASGSGMPLLFPFPGRIRGTVFRADDHDYVLEPGDGRGNAIHGFVHERAWRVLQQEPTRVVAEFCSAKDDPQLRHRWPTNFQITATYSLSQTRLAATYCLHNPDDQPLPCGFGIHPYFRLPLDTSSAEACRVRLPVAGCWELRDMIPTGIKLPCPDADRLQAGVPFGTMQYDDVFTDLVKVGERCVAGIEDPVSGARIALAFDASFRECVVYTPPHREAICIEPYTCVPDAWQLEQTGVPSGWWLLAPGESRQVQVEIEYLAGVGGA